MKRVILAVALGALLVGCGPPEKRFSGQWVGNYEVPMTAIEELKKIYPKEYHEYLSQVYKPAELKLDLRSDKTYTLEINDFTETRTVEGTWSVVEEANTLTLSGPPLNEYDKIAARQLGMTEMEYQTLAGTSIVFVVEANKKTLSNTTLIRQVELKMTLRKR